MNTLAIEIRGVQLHEGDAAAIEEGYSTPNYIIGKIKRITATGQMVIEVGSEGHVKIKYRFDANGNLWHTGNGYHRPTHLVPLTDEIKVKIMRRRIAAYEWNKASPETIMEVARLLGMEK